jgi:hypothetical protein
VLAVFSSFSIDIAAWRGNFLGAKPALKKPSKVSANCCLKPAAIVARLR